MTVSNYYQLSESQLDDKSEKIKLWLFHYPDHKERPRAEFALQVALCAKTLKRDSFVQNCIDFLT